LTDPQDSAEVMAWRKAERQRLIDARRVMPSGLRRDYSRLIASRLENLIGGVSGLTVGGYWLGYGGGFFDRTLAALTNVRRAIGVGYSSAALATIHPQWNDIPMDHLVTEKDVTNHPAP
jgi:5-formyltetrahydrofolate cyclo-ligase